MGFTGNVQIVAGDEAIVGKIRDELEAAGIETRGSPDFFVRTYASFGVDEARELSLRASSRALQSRRTFIIVASHVTTEAQNALLKTLEEPANDALFFIVVPSPHQLLPTLRSRAHILEMSARPRESGIDPAAFLKALPEHRIEMLKPLLDKDDDDRRDIGNGIAFLATLEHTLAQKPLEHHRGLQAVYRARKYWGDKGALSKALLEQVALLV